MKRAIVLSGGGSKGAYQIGVWKALRHLNIKYDIVTGTSVGALNAALMTQNTYFRAIIMWKFLKFKHVVDEKLNVDIDTNEGKKEILKAYAKNITTGGMSINNLEKTIIKNLNIRKIYKSNIDMGIVTVKVKNLEPVELTKKQINKKELKDYLIASASCFPAFKKKDIGDEQYIDGGLYDNLPINLAISMGATEVIAVDLKEIGIKQKVDNKNIPIITISPKNDIGSFLIFDSKLSRRAIKLGYNDTLKTFNKLDGDRYTFKKDDLINNYKKYNLSNEFLEAIENLGYIFNIDDSKIYSIKKYNKILIGKFKKIKKDIDIKEILKEKKIKKIFSNKYMVKYIYNLIIKNDEKLDEFITLFPNEYKGALYLKLIMEDL